MPSTRQQNGVAERRNRTLLEMVRSMMVQANLPISYWGDALLTAAYILNRVPSKLVSSTPYELWTGKKPNLSYFQPWGSAGIVHDTSHKYGTLGPRRKKCIFIRYSKHSKGYVLIGEQTDGRVTEIESRDMDFIEDEFPTRGEVERNLEFYETMDREEGILGRLVQNEEEIPQTPRDSESDLLPSGSIPFDVDSQQPQPRRSLSRNLPRRHFEIEGEAFMIALHDNDEPRIVQEALSSFAKDEWIKVVNDEIESMRTNQVWDLVNLPLG
jgi:hypothetical protein